MSERRAVFIDVGGPLYPDENFLKAAHQAINVLRASRNLAPVSFADAKAVFDRVRNTRGGSLRTSLAAEFLGEPGDRERLHDTIAPRWTHPEGSLYPDVHPFLAALAGRVVLGVVANQEKAAVDALSRDGLSQFIDVWGISAQVGLEKPSPEFFQWALDQAGVEPKQAVHVGNRFTHDVMPAHQLGMKTVWVLRGEAPDNPVADERKTADIVVDSLEGLAPRVLALWGGDAD